MRVGVCELHPELLPESTAWRELARRACAERPELLLLGEMPFGPWFSSDPVPDPAVFERSCQLHERGLAHLEQLGARVVLGTRPARRAGRPVNEAFVWTAEDGLRSAHFKQYFPDEEGYFEARWFEAGERHFRVTPAGPAQVGFLICTEVMFGEHARHYGRRGANLIAVPRAVGPGSLARWLVAMRMAAIVSGCYVISSNRAGLDARGQTFGGCGWIVDPSGDLLGQTSGDSPLAVCDIDFEALAKRPPAYPCYVPELA